MSLLGNIANREICSFLRTATIKNSYFAEQSFASQVIPSMQSAVPMNEAPYYKHIAGEYILKEAIPESSDRLVTNPKTGVKSMWSYGASSTITDAEGIQTKPIPNVRIYAEDAFDEMMYITSLDTQEEIPFTLEFLHAEYASDPTAVHAKTLEAYKLPSRYYELLCERYPKQVDLIKAIVYPVKASREITEAEKYAYMVSGRPIPSQSVRRREALVAKQNFEILNYDDTLLEENERVDIVQEMRSFVDLINERWNVKEFTFEENYAAVLWAVLWSILPLGLIARRYLNIKTPFVHSNHIWDYLISHGLESYKGYLNTHQTLFLYKNIEYILNNRGKQQITNLLIDELLSDAGLNIKCKTMVLDTTKTLDTEHQFVATSPLTQCETCGLKSVCHKKITDMLCPHYTNTSTLCKADPIVLTEEFAGANKQKIINALVNQYGYSENEAVKKYERSVIWRDDEVMELRDAFDRDQLLDVNGETSTLQDLIDKEYEAKLEPDNSIGEVERQRKELQHISGTYAPTKVLEITKNSKNAKFEELCRKFVIETLMHIAPKYNASGAAISKTNALTYTISLTNVGGSYLFTYSELLAGLYLGFVKQNLIDYLFDHVNADTVYQRGVKYYRIPKDYIPGEPEQYTNQNKVIEIQVTDDMIGQKVDPRLYIWAPKLVISDIGDLATIEGHEFVTNILESGGFKFPVPDKIKFGTTFKFGLPVKQKDLYFAWKNGPDVRNEFQSIPKNIHIDKVAFVGNIAYAMNKTMEPKDPLLWDGFDEKIELVGFVKNGAWHDDVSEIPLIPQYFRWHSRHMTPEEGTTCVPVSKRIFKELSFDTDAEWEPPVEADPTLDEDKMYYDPLLQTQYKRLDVERYFDVDGFISRYVDLTENILTQTELGSYLTSMFNLLEATYVFASGSGSVCTHQACQTVLEACLYRGFYKVNLTSTPERSMWPPEGALKYIPEKDGFKVATYEDWFKTSGELGTLFKTIDSSVEREQLWDAFNATAYSALLEKCELPYIQTTTDQTTVDKLRELVQHLSSYKVTFVKVDDKAKTSDSFGVIVSDPEEGAAKEELVEYFDPLREGVCSPHAGGFTRMSNGEFFAYTKDVFADATKVYYKRVYECDTSAFSPWEIQLSGDSVTYASCTLPDGMRIPYATYYEIVNWYDVLGITNRSLKLEFTYDHGQWYYRTGRKTEIVDEIPATEADNTLPESEQIDTFLPLTFITKAIQTKFACKKYRKMIMKPAYIWSDYIKSDELKALLDPVMITDHISDSETVTFPVYEDESSEGD